MRRYLKFFFENIVQDSIDNPTFFTTAEVTEVGDDIVSFLYKDKQGLCKIGKVNVKNSNEYSIGDILDIQICGSKYPEIFVTRRKENS